MSTAFLGQSNMTIKTITLADLLAVSGVEGDFGSRGSGVGVPDPDLCYSELSSDERDQCLLRVLQVLDGNSFDTTGPKNLAKWESGWRENLHEFISTNGCLEALQPKYFKHQLLRYQQRFIRAHNAAFELNFYTAVRRILFHRYLRDFQTIIEFGCGTGTSLLMLAEMYPDTLLVGCDWATSSQGILAGLATQIRRHIVGMNFDMFAPHEEVPFSDNCAVITLHAMEQLGPHYGRFLDYLLRKKPRLCLHLEPIEELYDDDHLLDHLAKQYHQRRGYLAGFLTHLRRLEGQGEVSLLDVRRLYFGSFFHEAYSVVVWAPCRSV